MTSGQKGVLWWAAHHRHHHRFSDQEDDLHSPTLFGFFWSHVGWIISDKYNDTRIEYIADFAKYPELRWLNKYHLVPPAALGVVLWLIGGWPLFIWGFCLSTVLLWHDTFTINSLSHLFGSRRYETTDQSRNNWLLALLTMGEGWHNNHHAYQASVRQGFRWWEYDPTYYALRILSWFGLVWDLHLPPRAVIRGEHRLGRLVIDRIAGQLAASFPVNQIAHQVREALALSPRWAELQTRIASTRNHAESFWSEFDLPEVPSLDEVRRYARERLAQTPSLEDIAVRAREQLLELVYARLSGAGSAPQSMSVA